MEASVKDNGNGTYSCSYVPRKPVKHTAMVSWGGVSIPNSPFRVSRPSPEPLTALHPVFLGHLSRVYLSLSYIKRESQAAHAFCMMCIAW